MDPFSIALALGLSAVGSYYQNQAQQDILDRQRQLRVAEQSRQQVIDEQRQAAIQAAQKNFTPDAQQTEQKSLADQLAAYITPTERPAPNADFQPGNAGTPTVVQDTLKQKLAGALQKGQDYAKNLSTIGSFGQLNFNNGVNLGRTGETVGQLNANSANSSALLGNELNAASMTAGRTDATLGDLFNGSGNIAFLYGLNGGTLGSKSALNTGSSRLSGAGGSGASPYISLTL